MSRRERKAYNEGYKDGHNDGYLEGYKQGLHDGNPFTLLAEAVANVAKELAESPEIKQAIIEAQKEQEEIDIEWDDEN